MVSYNGNDCDDDSVINLSPESLFKIYEET